MLDAKKCRGSLDQHDVKTAEEMILRSWIWCDMHMEDVSLHPAEYLLVLSYSGSEWSFVIKNSLSANARSTTEVNKFHGPLCIELPHHCSMTQLNHPSSCSSVRCLSSSSSNHHNHMSPPLNNHINNHNHAHKNGGLFRYFVHLTKKTHLNVLTFSPWRQMSLDPKWM